MPTICMLVKDFVWIPKTCQSVQGTNPHLYVCDEDIEKTSVIAEIGICAQIVCVVPSSLVLNAIKRAYVLFKREK